MKCLLKKYQQFGMLFTEVVLFRNVCFRRTFATGLRKKEKNMAKIVVNGEAQTVDLPLNVTGLIQQLLVESPEMVSVQVNEEFAEREDWEQVQLKEGDRVDFLYFMGGGSISPLS